MPKVSVIVPVYKVEPYVEECARSLFSQTLDDLEILFIDDCTPDRSMELVKECLKAYPERMPGTRFVRMPVNSGQAAVRKKGLQMATGDYVIHCDSDDWACPNMYELMYRAAQEAHADIVTCDYFIHEGSGVQAGKGWPARHRDPVAAVLDGRIPGYLWNKLVRRSLYDKLAFFPKANIWEDKTLVAQLFHHSSQSVFLREPLYHYRIHPGGICLSEDIHKRIRQQQDNVETLCSFLEKEHLTEKYAGSLCALKSEVQAGAYPLPRAEYLSLYPEIRWRQLLSGRIPLQRRLGHLTKMLGIHGITHVFRRSSPAGTGQ